MPQATENDAFYARFFEAGTAANCDGMIARDADCQFDAAGWNAAASAGLCGLTLSKDQAGQGLTYQQAVAALEAFGKGCADNGLSLALGAHLWGCLTMMTAGGQALASIVQSLASGQSIGALAVSEEQAGSDLNAMQCRATKAGDYYRLDGQKIYVTNAPIADYFVILAVTAPGQSGFAHSAFCVPADTVGLSVSQPAEKMGMRTAAMGSVTLENCCVPVSSRIGGEGAGLPLFLKAIEMERAFILAPAIGAMERLWEQTRDYAASRSQFGQAIAGFQGVQHRLVEMRRRIDTSRLIIQDAAKRKDYGQSIAVQSSMAKLTISDNWVANCEDALAIYAGRGYLTQTGIERELRDALGSKFYSGTDDVLRNQIARELRLDS